MTTLEKIKKISDNEAVVLYQGFSGYLHKQVSVDLLDVINNLPGQLSNDPTIGSIPKVDVEELESAIIPEEVIPVVRTLLEQWAANLDMAPVLEDFMESYKIKPLAAGMILAVGSVLLMSIISTSLKIEFEDGKLKTISYDSANISKNAVEIVKAVLGKLPESLSTKLS